MIINPKKIKMVKQFELLALEEVPSPLAKLPLQLSSHPSLSAREQVIGYDTLCCSIVRKL
jgi:hypothetical protein